MAVGFWVMIPPLPPLDVVVLGAGSRFPELAVVLADKGIDDDIEDDPRCVPPLLGGLSVGEGLLEIEYLIRGQASLSPTAKAISFCRVPSTATVFTKHGKSHVQKF